jgi:hypothetical protein
LAQKLLFLFLNLEANHTSEDAQTWLNSDQDELLDSLKSALQIQVSSQRTMRDESQITSLFRVLLELSGGEVDLSQHNFDEDVRFDDELFTQLMPLMILRLELIDFSCL